MFSKVIAVVLVGLLLHGHLAAQTPQQPSTQTAAKMQEVLRKSQEKDKAVKVTLKQKIDNQRKFSGKVSEISDTGFALTDQKTGATTKLAYADVRQAKQKGLSKGWTITLVVVAGVVIAAVVATKPWQSE